MTWARLRDRTGELALWVGAVGGAAAVLLALASAVLGVRPLVFSSGSMGPEIPTGSLALSRPVDASQLRPGDVISVVNAAGTRVTHRVVSTAPSGDAREVVLQGDANPSPDAETHRITEADLVLGSVPRLGYVATAWSSPGGAWGTGLVVAALLWWGFRRGPRAPTHRRPRPAVAGVRPGTTSSVVVAAVLAAAVVVTTTGGRAWALFTDAASVTSGAFTARTVERPNAITCSGGGALATSITVSWPHRDLDYDYQVLVRDADDAVRATYNVTGTGAVGGNLNRVIPGGLLGSIGLGTFYSTVELRSRLKGTPSWLSSEMRTWTYREVVIVAGLSIYCT